MRILFFGTPLFARNILESLCKNSDFEIIGIVTQDDKPFGRKKELKAPECKIFGVERRISVFQPKNLNELDLDALKPDIILVVAFGRILPKKIIDNFTCINIHASILPKSRGASPMQDMILRNDEFIGVSIMKMSYKLDEGDILAIRFIENLNYDIIQTSEILAQNAANLAIKTLKNLDSIKPLKQINADSSYCKKISKNDGKVAFLDARKIYQKYLAYKIWPQIFMENGTKLFDISLNDEDSSNQSGEITHIGADYIIIGCKKGSIMLKNIQAVGKNKMDIISYLRGKRLKVGDKIV